MSAFKSGDKVVVTTDAGGWYGEPGTVSNEPAESDYDYTVILDNRNGIRLFFLENELSLRKDVSESSPDPAVRHPAHYQHPSGIEVMDIVKHETFVRGNILKYVFRAPYKGEELRDLLKAKEYLDIEIARVQDA